MKHLFVIILIFLSTGLMAQTSTPRETMQTFLKSMVAVKDGTQSKSEYYERAISTFQMDHIDSNLQEEVGKKYAEELINTFDKIRKVDYAKIPENPDAAIWYFDKRMYQGKLLEISLTKVDDKWLFSKATLLSLEDYHAALIDKNIIKGVKKLVRFSDRVKAALPEAFSGRWLVFENWQWFGLFLILVIAFFIEKIALFLIKQLLNKSSKIVKASSTVKLEEAVGPLAKIIFVFCSMKLITFLDFAPNTTATINRVLYICMSLMSIWFAHKVIEFISEYFQKKSELSETKFDDILVPLLTKTAFVVIYVFGALLVAKSFTIDVTGLIAGLGIGGLAFAFAAKDTLANFFGSIMLVLDRPFDIGDIIVAGDIEGIVTEVGFRSTRIRTFNDSLITISNGELMNRPIDNKGKRRFRRMVTTLGVEYDTPAEKIEAFCEGIRQLILNHKWTRKDNFHVYFVNFGASSLDIQVVVYWETEDYARELTEKHRLMVDILRLATELEVDFAFPTQTVHMFNETKANKNLVIDKSFDIGKEKAAKVASSPISLKNPRSNSKDKEQFGDNDIGL